MSRAAVRAASVCMTLNPFHPSRTTSAFSTSLCTWGGEVGQVDSEWVEHERVDDEVSMLFLYNHAALTMQHSWPPAPLPHLLHHGLGVWALQHPRAHDDHGAGSTLELLQKLAAGSSQGVAGVCGVRARATWHHNQPAVPLTQASTAASQPPRQRFHTRTRPTCLA